MEKYSYSNETSASPHRGKGQRVPVLFTVETGTYLNGLIKISRLLLGTRRYAPVAVFPLHYPGVERDKKVCVENGIVTADELENLSHLQIHMDSLLRLQVKLLNAHPPNRPFFLSRTLLLRLLHWIEQCLYQNPFRIYCASRRRLNKIRQYLHVHHIQLLYFAAVNVGYDTDLFLKAAKQLKLPTLVFPQWMAGPQEPASYIWSDPDFAMRSPLNRIIGLFFPKWVYTFHDKKYLRIPGAQVLAKEWLGIAPAKPWVLHSGFSDVIAVQSQAMKEYGERLGLRTERMRVVGSFENDIMTKITRSLPQTLEIYRRKYRFPKKNKILLSALPPDFLTNGTRRDVEFKTFDELVRFWVTSLTKQLDFSVLISLHPSLDPAKMKYIEQWGATIADQHISELLPVCDFFVASISATIQWAITCGKPVLNYDVYKYHYADYTAVDGVIFVERATDFTKELERLTANPAYLALIRKKQERIATRWGTNDGKAAERILTLFDTMIRHKMIQTNPLHAEK